MPREKRYREKRSSSYSSESSYERRKIRGKHKRNTRSRDRSESSSYRRKGTTSKSKYKKRSYSRSLSRDRKSISRDRYESKSRRRSSSRSKSKRSKPSASRDHSHSRSSSRSRSKHSKSNKKHRKRSHSSSLSSLDTEESTSNRINLDDTETKVEKAVKAAESVGLTMKKISMNSHKEFEVPVIHDSNLIAELNSDTFIQTSFTSSRSKKQSQNIVIDLNAETVKIPETGIKIRNDDSIINFDELPSQEELKEMWIKKLCQYRKKILKGEI